MEGEVLNHHVFSLSSLVELCKRNSRVRGREILSDCLHPSSLKVLSVGNFNPMERGILSDIFHHSSLKTLSLHNCNLMEEGIFTNIWNLPLLVELSLSNCNLREGEILNHICHLSSLLKSFYKFQSFPKAYDFLMPWLSLLETLSSPSSSLGFSLFKCFKSAIEEFERGSYWSKEITVFIPGNNGIPEWIGYKKKGSEIATELPENWWEDNNFLGFALCSVFVPLHIESKEDPCLKCKMNFPHYFEDPGGFVTEFWSVDELSFRRSYPCCHNGGESNKSGWHIIRRLLLRISIGQMNRDI
ncbi:hypothetical protein CK203_088746 [Vitis vinifera]|uniref:C-JID domain-containing protein n=1 Tax=Vitis vinifera TaxID=29760 RepID=A0A438CLQ3_VITVI|nr:hypothetical protein CK203_088746 [Vitis vinifera]